MLKLWNIFDGSVELLTAALVAAAAAVVVAFVDAGPLVAPPPPNIDDSALALAKLNPIEELGVDDGTVASVAAALAVVDDGVVIAAPSAPVTAVEVTGLGVISDPVCICAEFEFPRANENEPMELGLLVDCGAADGALFSLLSLVDLFELSCMPRSNLNVVDEAVGANGSVVVVVKRVDFVADCTFGVDGCAVTGVTIVGFVAAFVPGVAAGFNIGVLFVAVGVSNNGIFPVAAGVDVGADASSFWVDDFDKFNVFSDGFDCDINENDGDFWTPPLPPPPPKENGDDAAAPNILTVSVLVPPNENGLAVAAGASNEMALLYAPLVTLVSLVVFATVVAPNPNDIDDFSVFPKNDFDALEFIDDEGGASGCGCGAADLAIVIVAGFSATSFGLNGAVVLVTCCGRIDICIG